MAKQLGSPMKDVIQMSIDAGRMGAAFSEAARWGEIELVQQLLAEGVSVDIRDESGGTALMNAASGGELRIIQLLIANGADVNTVDSENGMTPLMWALAALHKCPTYVKITKELLKAGARLDTKALDGRTAYDRAIERDCDELTKLVASHPS